MSGTERTCIECQRTLPLDKFYSSGHGNGRRRTCIRCLHKAAERERRARGAKARHPRFNARGFARCGRCEKYKHPEEFRKHSNRPGNLWWACRSCEREIERERYIQRTSTVDGALEYQRKSNERRRRSRANQQKDRRQFVRDSIKALRRRGFTKTEISRLMQTGVSSLIAWETDDTRKITRQVEERFAVLLRETSHLPFVEPVTRRRLPHPDFDDIQRRTADKIASIPTRNRWKERGAA
jgi:DNA-binding transcriptional regulator YiaG